MDVHSDAQHTPGALLPLPRKAPLSDPQVRGAACAWCAVILAPATAVSLGERCIRLLDRSITVRPRGCRTCTGERVQAALERHAAMCESCVDSPTGCETASSLRRLGPEVSR